TNRPSLEMHQLPILDVLWSTDGSPAGTSPVTGPGGEAFEFPAALTLFDNRLYFFASTVSDPSDYPLWRTDGTPEGTIVVPGAHGIAPVFQSNEGGAGVAIQESAAAVIGRRLFFVGTSSRSPNNPYGLYETDSTGTAVLLADFAFAP